MCGEAKVKACDLFLNWEQRVDQGCGQVPVLGLVLVIK